MEDSGGAEINKLDDVVISHNTVIELEVAMSKAHLVEVLDAIAYLAKDAIDLWATHSTRHDHAKQIIRSILHDLIVVTMI